MSAADLYETGAEALAAGAAPGCLPSWYPDRRFMPAAPDLWRQSCTRVAIGLLLAGGDHGPTRSALAQLAAGLHPAWSRVGAWRDSVPMGVAWRVAEGLLGYRAMPTVEGADGRVGLPLFEPAQVRLYATAGTVDRAGDREGVRLADTVSWPVAAPADWALERGAFAVLGEEIWVEARWDRDWPDPEPLRLHATPASWAAASADRGVCLLDRPVPAVRRRLRAAATIICDGPEHAAEVQALLKRRERRSPLPELRVPAEGAAA